MAKLSAPVYNKPIVGSITGSQPSNDPYDVGASYTSQLVNNFASYGLRRAMGSTEKFSWDNLTNVDTLSIAINTEYNACKVQKKKDKKIKKLMEDKDRKKPEDAVKDVDNMDKAEDGLGGIFLRRLFESIGNDIKGFGSDLGRAWDTVSDFAESTGNLFSGYGF